MRIISLIDILHKFEDNFEKVLYSFRWFLAPVYFILVLIVIVIAFKFITEFIDLIFMIGKFELNEFIMKILELIDLTLIGNLVLTVAFAGYENSISRIDVLDKNDENVSWREHLDLSGLKLKVIGSVIAISIIELLQDFLNISSIDPNIEFWRIVLHLTFVVTGVTFALMEMLTEKKHTMKSEEKLAKLEEEQFKDL